jgi:hypothetical protein
MGSILRLWKAWCSWKTVQRDILAEPGRLRGLDLSRPTPL